MTFWPGELIIKDCKALATKNRQRRLINAKLEGKKTQNMRKKHANGFFNPTASSGLPISASYGLDADSVSYHHIWRKYPDIADDRECLLAKS